MKLLALDISSTNIGYVVWDGDIISLAGTIALTSTDLTTRIIAGQARIEGLVDRVEPDAFAYEGPAYKTFPLALIAQQRMVGVALLVAGLRRIPIMEVPPSSAKKALTSRGNASKDLMMTAAGAFAWRPDVPLDEHQADALGVALAAWPALRQRKNEQKRETKRRAA